VFDWLPGDDSLAIQGLEFRDSIFTDANTNAEFENAVVRLYITNRPDPDSWFFVSYTTTFQVNDSEGSPVANATVTITDKDSNQIYDGVTNAQGSVEVVLNDFRVRGDIKTEYATYTVVASSGGNQIQQQFNADSKQTINLLVSNNVSMSSAAIETLLSDNTLNNYSFAFVTDDSLGMESYAVNSSRSPEYTIHVENGTELQSALQNDENRADITGADESTTLNKNPGRTSVSLNEVSDFRNDFELTDMLWKEFDFTKLSMDY